jgi:hypothetical protein
VSFFICQAHLPQNDVDGLHGTLEPGGGAQFLEGEIVLFRQQGAEVAAVRAYDGWFAPGEAMARGNIAGAQALLEEFFHQAHRDAETAGDLVASTLAVVIRRQDTFAQIQRSRSHGQTLSYPPKNGYSFY